MTTERCNTCNRSPERMNGWASECSHVDCPHRRKAWSERPQPHELRKGPWSRPVEADPIPLDKDPLILPPTKD